MNKKKGQKTDEPIIEEQTVNGTEDACGDEIPETVTLTKEEIKQVREQVESLKKEKTETVELLQRLQADFDNYRKRNAMLAADSLEEGARNMIKALLPALDNFDRAMNAVPDDQHTAWVEGVGMVRKQIYDILEKNGLTEIEASGQFDPELHNAVLQEEVEGKESGDIIEVLQKGYKVNNRIIRHTMVKVAK